MSTERCMYSEFLEICPFSPLEACKVCIFRQNNNKEGHSTTSTPSPKLLLKFEECLKNGKNSS